MTVTVGLALFGGCAAPGISARRWSLRGGMVHGGGRSHFPLEIYGVKTESDYRVARFLGFDAVCDDGPLAFVLSRKYGMMLTLPNWFDTETSENFVREKVRAFRKNASIVAWNLADEPDLRSERSPPEVLEKFARVIREEDPRRLVSVTLNGSGKRFESWPRYAEPVDVLRLDPYPVAEKATFESMRKRLALGRELTGNDKSMWVVLQAWRGRDVRLPTADELRLSAYLALIEGARGVSVFDFNLDTWMGDPAFFEALLRTMAQMQWIRELALHGTRRRLSLDAGDTVACEWIRGRISLIALANTAGEAIAAQLPELQKEIVRSGPVAVVITCPNDAPAPWKSSHEVFGREDGQDVYDPVYRLGAPSERRLLYRNPGDRPWPARWALDQGSRVYLCDLHGDRWERLDPRSVVPPHSTVEIVTRETPFATRSEKAFARAGMSITLEGPAPAHESFRHTLKRYFVKPGEPLTLTCTVTGARDVRLDAMLFCYDKLIDDAKVERTQTGPDRQSRFVITTGLPDDAPDNIDLELRLELSWKRHFLPCRITRTIRLRTEASDQLS